MYQPEPTAYLQVSAGYGIAHSLPEYTFEETPLGLHGGGGIGGGGGSSNGGYGGGLGTAGAGLGGIGGIGGIGGAGSLIYTSPIFSASSSIVGPASGPFQFHHANTPNTTSSSNASTASSPHHQRSPHSVKMEPSLSNDLAAEEAAAREYQPRLEGPLVGKRTSSTAITEEYAKADPIYVQKTIVLPQTYSHYRPVQGDGNCGWRAIGFGYFETLVNGGSKAQIDSEKQRLESLKSYIENVGGLSPFVFQDMADETIELLQRISNTIGDRARAMAELEGAFNNPDIANSILYHMRLLASSWLKGNPDSFSAFITSDIGVSGYSTDVIERPNVEIDNLGLVLLVNVLLKPIGFVLEVAYLDRSVGSQVNMYRFPEEANGQHPSTLGPIIHLLYRPDHYDILYPAEVNLTPPPQPQVPMQQEVNLQVHRVATFSQNYEIGNTPIALHNFAATDMHPNPLTLIPGFDSPPPSLNSITLAAASPITSYSPSPASPWMPTPFADTTQQESPTSLPIRPQAPAQQNHPLRFSEYCQLPEYVGNDTWRGEPVFQTSTFKNSHFNVAHYNNPNFQPEEYRPEADDYHDPPPRAGSKKRASV